MTVLANFFPESRGMRALLRICFAAGVLAPFCNAGEALTMAELLGGRRALQCYHNDSNAVFCKDLLSGETWKVLSRKPDTWGRWCGTINRDGTKLTCNDGSVPIVVNLDGTNKEDIAVQGMNCHFWRDNDGNDWVVYTGENENKNRAGTTWKVRVDGSTNKPVESTRTKIADIQFSCGFNGSGVYLGESYGTSLIKNVVTGKQSPDFNDTRNCVGSMHPGDKPWIMFEESPAHDRVGIFEWNESDNSARRIWRLEKESIFGHWSTNNENYCVILNNQHYAHNSAPLDLVRLSVDTSDTGDNDGSWVMAPMGINGMVGGPWVEHGETGTSRLPHLNHTHDNHNQRGNPVTPLAPDSRATTAIHVWDARGRTIPRGTAGTCAADATASRSPTSRLWGVYIVSDRSVGYRTIAATTPR